MSRKKSPPPGDANEEVSALIEEMDGTLQRLEELTAGEVDTVADREGRPFLLRRAQEQLRHSEAAKQAAILNALPAHIALLDAQGRIVSVNQAWQRFGSADVLHGPGYGIGVNYIEICESARGDDASEAHQVAEGIRSVLDGGVKSFSIEYACHSPTEQRWFLLTVTPLAGDHPNGVVVMHLDITERKQAAQELRESEDRYHDLVEHNRDLICTHDLEGKLLSVNAVATRLTGYSREALLRMSLADLIVPAARDGLAAYLAEIRTAGAAHGLMRICTASGEKRWWEYENTLRTEGVAVAVVRGLAQDVTERLEAKRELEDSEERFRGLVEQSIAGIYVIQDGKFAYVNPRFAEIFGYGSAEEIIGCNKLSVVAAKDRETVAENLRQRTVGEVASVSYQFTGLRKDGSTIEVGVHSSRATYGGQPATIGLLQDISEKKRAEEKIQRYVTQIKNALMSTVQVATTLGEMRDSYTAGHQRRVAEIAVAIGVELGFDVRRLEGLRVAGYLHDIGKITIPAEILSKPAKLSPIEFQLIQGHAQAGYDVLKNVEFPWPVAEVALQHHERIDGSGYPQGLKGEAILLEARIMAVADVVEAISSHRPYRPGLGIDKALAEIERGRGSAYDPIIADACLMLFREKGYAIPV